MSGPIGYLPIAARKWSESCAPLGPAASGFFRGLTAAGIRQDDPLLFWLVEALPVLLVGLLFVVAEFLLDIVNGFPCTFKESATEARFFFQHLLTQKL